MLGAESNQGKRGQRYARGIAEDLDALRKLALQLHRIAATADEEVLRAIMGKREALMESISSRLSKVEPEVTDQEPPASPRAGQRDQRETFARTVAEIVEMDRESAKVLKRRADEVAVEIQKIRAGRKWRESAQ